MITNNDKETFFTSFLMRDKAFDVIRELLEKDTKTSQIPRNTGMLKRTFIRYQGKEGEGKEHYFKCTYLDSGEEEEDEEEEEQDELFVEPCQQLNQDGPAPSGANIEESKGNEGEKPQGEIKFDLKSADSRKKLDDICLK